MTKAKASYAIWTWGTETKEQYVQALKDISAVGYRFCESVHPTVDIFMGRDAEFDEINEQLGVKPVSFYFHFSGDYATDIDLIKRKAPFMAKHGIDRASLQGMGNKGAPATREMLEATVKTAREYGEVCAAYGIVPCFHPHHGTVPMYADEIDYVMENTDPDRVAFCPDTAHLVAGMCDPVAVIRKYASRVKFTHMKDISGSSAISAGFTTGVQIYTNFRELGEGDVDFPSVFKILDDVGYDGYYNVELDITRTTHKDSARISMEYLNRVYYK